MQTDVVQQMLRRLRGRDAGGGRRSAVERPPPCASGPSSSTPHLARELTPLYVVHGDETAARARSRGRIRAKARADGYTERDVLIVERGFNWAQLAAAAAAPSLFASRKLIELRIPTGKPGTDGARRSGVLRRAAPRHRDAHLRCRDSTGAARTRPGSRRSTAPASWSNVFPVERARAAATGSARRLARQKQRRRRRIRSRSSPTASKAI